MCVLQFLIQALLKDWNEQSRKLALHSLNDPEHFKSDVPELVDCDGPPANEQVVVVHAPTSWTWTTVFRRR
jgi:hypothetical protein